MFCKNCGFQMNDDEVFCSNCGNRVASAPASSGMPNQGYNQQPMQYQSAPYQGGPVYQPTQYQAVAATAGAGSLFLVLGIVFSALLIIGTLALFILGKTGWLGWAIGIPLIALFTLLQILVGKKGAVPAIALFVVPLIAIGATFFLTPHASKTGKIIGGNASLVSKGVNLDDLGNIINGQYFFDDGTNQFYSSFDSTGASHIYRTEKSTGLTTTIFNGFGWSFSVFQGWLYFSGNEGTVIDATYNLFRIKTDGTQLEHLNTKYCYGLNFYNNYLYYITKLYHEDTNFTICRSALDGSNEESLVTDGNGYCIIYNNKLYYSGLDGLLYSANPDGTGAVAVISTESITSFIIGNGKIIFLDSVDNLKIADIDGSNITLVKAPGTTPVGKINSYKGTIFYVEYGEWISDLGGYPYTIYSIQPDGTNNIRVYDGTSNGFYVNILNNKVFVLDYAHDAALGTSPAITKNMDLDGQNLTTLYR